MKKYSVKQLSDIAKVSIRTLHHYDEIGLLKPVSKNKAGYRYYGENELLRLQQILFYKELEFKLDEIQRILDDPEFEVEKALHFHREELEKKATRIQTLLKTVDSTILKLKEDNTMLTPEEMYEGFSKEQIDAYNKEIDEKYDPELVKESRRRVAKMSKQEFAEIKKEQEAIPQTMVALMEREPGDREVQNLIARHHAIIEKFYPCSAEIYKGLGELYVSDERFMQFYDKYKEGLASFMQKAMEYYCENVLKG